MADNKVMDMTQKELFETFVQALRAVNAGGGGKSSSSPYFNFRNGGGDSLREIYKKKGARQEYIKERDELSKILEKASGSKALTKDEKAFLSEHGFKIKNLKELRANVDGINKAIKELDRNEKSCNFGNRLIGYNNIMNKIGGAFKGMDQSIMGFVDPWAKADAAASKYAKTVGATKSGLESLRSTTIDNVVKSHIGIDFNMSADELIEAQQNYVNGVGRSLRIDSKAQTALAAMHAVMGGKEQELAVAFENFGVNLEKTGEHAGKMFDEASRTGVSFEKYSDAVAKNIKIAQNYTFKNGLKGLESMAKKAVALKMDMGQVASFAERVSSVEGSIDVSSKLQVLGGPFAAMSDPLGMMNEGLLDMEGLMDRVTKMIGGLGGFDKTTGEVKVSAFNKQRIRAAAKAMGMDYSQMMESVNAQAKRKEIESQILSSGNARNLDKDMQELLKNSATFDKNGRAGVSINGEFKTIDKLTNEDYSELVKETQNESADIKDIAKNVRSLYEIRSGIKKQRESIQAKATEKLGIGDFMKKITSLVGHWNILLGGLVALKGAGALINVFSNGMDVVDMVGGKGAGGRMVGNRAGRSGRFLRGKSTNAAQVTNNAKKIMHNGKEYKLVGDKLYNAKGRSLNGAVKNNILKGGKVVEGTTETVAKTGRNVGRVGRFGRQLKQSKQAVRLIKAGKGMKVASAGMKSVGKKIPVVGALLSAGFEAYSNKDKFKDRSTRGSAVGKTAGAAIGAGLGTILGGALAPVIGPLGPMLGGIAGEWVGKHLGGAIGKIQDKRVIKNRAIVDKELEKFGIKRKGDYKVKHLKQIDKAIKTGEMSDKLRKKLIEEGDSELVKKIDAIKAENQSNLEGGNAKSIESMDSDIKEATFKIEKAFINGNEIGTKATGTKNRIESVFPNDEKINKSSRVNNSTMFQAKNIAPNTKVNNENPLLFSPIAETGKNDDVKKLLENIKNGNEVPLSEKNKNGEFDEKTNAEWNKNQNQQPINNKIDLNITGTIKLVGADGKGVDFTKELLDDRDFKKELALCIKDQLNEFRRGSYIPQVNLA